MSKSIDDFPVYNCAAGFVWGPIRLRRGISLGMNCLMLLLDSPKETMTIHITKSGHIWPGKVRKRKKP